MEFLYQMNQIALALLGLYVELLNEAIPHLVQDFLFLNQRPDASAHFVEPIIGTISKIENDLFTVKLG